MTDSVPKGNTFESISLGSTIGKSGKAYDSPAINSQVPESVSATSDDDDLDPEEFLSQNSPEALQKERNVPIDSFENLDKMGILNSTTILGDKDVKKYVDQINNSNTISPVAENEPQMGINSTSSLLDSNILNSLQFSTQNPFDMAKSNSVYFPKLDSTRLGEKASLIKSLSNTNKTLQDELYRNIKIQKKLLANGEDMSRVRSFISHNFKQISENFYSLNELYSQEVSYNESLHESFKKWDNRREKILNKISSIKSNRNKHGSKLEKLLGESDIIDNEISDLEKKLTALKSKKKLINAEIEDTSSVLESRTSKYVETFRNLEKQGIEALNEFINVNNISSSEFENFIKYSPVNVTFSNNYKTNSKNNVIDLQSTESTPSTVIDTHNNKSHNDRSEAEFIGMQPFIVPEISNNRNDISLANHGHGLTPFEEGFEKGSKVSHTVRSNLNNFMKSLVSNPKVANETYVPTRQIDDVSNTINQKIDLASILRLLNIKEESSREILGYTSNQATLYHEYGAIWDMVVDVIKIQESKLLSQLSESTLAKDALDENIISIMNTSLKKIKSLVSPSIIGSASRNSNSSAVHNALFKSIIHEIKAICSALVVASGDKGYLEKVNEFKILLSTDKPYPKNVTKNQPQPKQNDTLSSSLKSATLYKPTKTVPLTGTSSVNFLSSGSSSLSSDVIKESVGKFHVRSSDNNKGLFNINSKSVKKND
ncbi:DEHA2B08844p [Debaryomyces hansenii CBS767]|uniref:DEHA2B08844p n=1 Tax=Debaryomyces hansenii (strain ATCC 36239 / CBS 767 / BCRC 21394 / JCM 1990 / NBRC 0083 / IGC 2968) TaxID=284592 RepID=Q6BWS9_DEBHA|nr:DEHA2B08844p [Debaryomyces hansenii CBS767]CAG85344.2 DEHA2B08844p [Debaryomyces hansenii CBS767]|eukprot:XP_457340.2 DEHA2B08844p [Debaryomyces hansenii CBS767]